MLEPSPGPYSKTKMRVLAAVGIPLSLFVVAMGLYEVATDNDKGYRIVAIGAVTLLVMLLAVPLAIRRGRM